MLKIIEEIHDRQPPPTKEQAGCDRFGFLPSELNCQFQGGAIEPVTNYEEVKKWVQEHLYHENLLAQGGSAFEPGILFPPQSWNQAHDPTTNEPPNVVQGSVRPSPLHRVPTSHYLRLDGVTDLVAEREGAAGFVTKIIGFLYDVPTQFHDWWFDGPTSIATQNLCPLLAVLKDFVSFSYEKWQSWKPEPRRQMISTLYMHGRAPGYQWDWERFAWEYTVTDACYKIANLLDNSRFPMDSHGKRIRRMCCEFGLRCGKEEEDWVKFVVELRNNLLHEARWSNAQPSTKSSNEAFMAPRYLHKFNQRLITRLLGYQNAFVASGWLTLSNASFDKKN